jgi:hypothetical protein
MTTLYPDEVQQFSYFRLPDMIASAEHDMTEQVWEVEVVKLGWGKGEPADKNSTTKSSHSISCVF